MGSSTYARRKHAHRPLAWSEGAFRVTAYADRGQPLAMLVLRFATGLLFAQSGWGKLANLAQTVEFFGALRIPAPHFHAVLVANVELWGGLCLILGLFARAWSLALALTMFVAIAVALLPEVEGFLELVTRDEFFYLAILLVIATTGPGRLSLDRWVRGKWFKEVSGAKPEGRQER